MTNQERREVIEQKILSALSTKNNPPSWGFAFGVWFARVTDSDDQTFLEYWEAETDDDTVNNWLVSVLVASGKYETDGNGSVSSKL